jgi:isoaspartyl peptidase/L-asparaginase-like protein (Ntn-hydrolase superfamily)
MQNGKTAQSAVEEAVKLVNIKVAGPYNSMGLVAIDLHGNIGVAHNSPNICWAYMKSETKEPVAALTATIVK